MQIQMYLKIWQTLWQNLCQNQLPYIHDAEGPDDMPAHIRTAITHTSENIPINNGHLVLGTWQGIYVWEHRQRSHVRELVVHIFG